MKRFQILATIACFWIVGASAGFAETLPPVSERFAAESGETPDFQRHVIPLAGRLGCNGRACHGSFQGQGGFRLSLFGYDFDADHAAMTKEGEPRVNLDIAEASKILEKPTMSLEHGGGEVITAGSWEYRLLKQWIEKGAKWDPKAESRLARLEVIPSEIIFAGEGEETSLKAIAHWEDGTSEDVTPLCRFRTNDDAVATVNDAGKITCAGAGDTHVIAFYDNGVTPVPVILPLSDRAGSEYPAVGAPTKIDELVLGKLRKLGAVPSDLCTDAEFLRRASLDITGTLPLPEEIEAFLADNASDKRTKKIDELLERPAYSAWWTTRLCDMTGASENTQIDNAFRNDFATQWYDWLHKRVQENVAYDEIVAGIALATSRQPDETYDEHIAQMALYFRDAEPAPFIDSPTMPYFWTRRNVRDRDSRALAFSHAFLGLRIECAQCHKHPFDQWSKKDFQDFSLMFANVQYGIAPDGRKRYEELQEKYGFNDKTKPKNRNELVEIVRRGDEIFWPEVFVGVARADRKKPNAKERTLHPAILGGVAVTIDPESDAREQLMEWMRHPENPYFARAFVNRVWANYFGAGIVDPPDDQNLANPPSNAPLLDYLSKGFIENKFDMKWLHREIAASHAYQRSWRPNDTNRLDTRNFSHARLRRLPAEVARDAMVQATAREEDVRTSLADATSRAIGPTNARTRSNQLRYVLLTFGKSERAANCDCERSDEPSILQTVYLRNDSELLRLVGADDGWIRETLDNWDGGASKELASVDEKRRDLNKTIERLKGAQERAVKEERENREERLGEKIAAAEREMKNLSAQAAELKSRQLSVSEADRTQWLRAAYLRTLSRPPTEAELAIGHKQFEEMKSPGDAMRDMLWALLNTKEFIVNH